MKKLILVLALLPVSALLWGQTKLGMINNTGMSIPAAQFNPAEMIMSTTQIQILPFSFEFGMETDAVKISSLSDFTKNLKDLELSDYVTYEHDEQPKKFDLSFDASIMNILVQSGKSAFGFGVRLRGNVLAHDIGESLISAAIDGINTDDANAIVNSGLGNVKLYGDLFAEIDLSYARTVFENEMHKVSLGVTGKYLSGLYTARGIMNDLDAYWDQDAETIDIYSAHGSAAYYKKDFGEALDNLSASSFFGGKEFGSGLGFNVGASYAYTPEDQDGYLIKAGVSVTDIGSIKFDEDIHQYQINVNRTHHYNTDTDFGEDPKNDDVLTQLKDEYMGTGEVTEETGSSYTMELPTSLNVSVDWRALSALYVAVNWIHPMSDEAKTASPTGELINVTPRLRTGSSLFSLPVTYSARYERVMIGFGAEVRGFFIGCDNLGFVVNDEFQGTNFYAGLAIKIGTEKHRRNIQVEEE